MQNSREKRPIFWPTNKSGHDFMRKAQRKTLAASQHNPHENAVAKELSHHSTLKWKRQAVWGGRIFDFWNHEKGVAIEVDGSSHISEVDAAKDAHLYLCSGIIVIRIENGDLFAVRRVCRIVWSLDNWQQRRNKLGLRTITNKSRAVMIDLAIDDPPQTVDSDFRERLERED